tara:strand:+ start:55 stop:330 length:276 start_codon:yes stop_codon:yes gene_type:complete
MSNTLKFPALFSEAKINQKKHKKKINEIYNRNILPPIPVTVNRTFKENNWPEAEINPKKLNKNLAKINNRLPSIGKGIKTKKKIEFLKTIY